MPTSTDQQVADSTANIEKVANDSSSSSTKMLDEVNKQLNDNGFKGNDEASKAIAKKLEQDNVLPKLVIAAFDSDQALKEFGDGTKFDAKKLEDAVDGKGEHDSPSERMLAQALLERLKTIDGAGNSDGFVTKQELESWAKGSTDQPVKAQTLNEETVKNIVDELHEAINQKTIIRTNDPDKTKIANLLDPLGEADRAAVEKAYHLHYDPNGAPDTLRRDLKSKLGGDNSVDWRTTEAVLNRHDGRTNDAGALMVALVQMNSNKDKGNTMLRNVLETLNDKQLADLDKDFREKYGKGYLEAINGSKDLSPETKEALPILTKGIEDRTTFDLVTLANVAVKYHDLPMFGESLRGDSNEAQSARAQLQADKDFLANFANAFPSDLATRNNGVKLSFENSVDPIALDYLREGQVSLATIAVNNTNRFIFDNKENVTLAVEHATEKEQNDYIQGKNIVEKRTKLSDLSDEQRLQVDYYNRVHTAFKNGGNDREVAIWEDILEHGHETIISQMAHSHDDGKVFGILSNTDKEKLFSAIENLSEDDWNRLKGKDPYKNGEAEKFRKEIEQSLDTYDKDDKKRVLELIDKKVKADSFEISKNIKRTISEVIDDNTGPGLLRLGTSYNTKNIVDQIIHMSPDEAQRYKDDPCYRNQIDGFVDAHLNVTEKLLIHSVLKDVAATGKIAETLKPTDQVLMDTISNASDADKLKHVQEALKDSALRDRLSKPDDQLSEDDLKIKRAFLSVLDSFYFKSHPTEGGTTADNNPNLKEYHDQIFKTGELPLAMQSNLDIPKADLIVQIANASESDRAALREKLSPAEQQILDAVIASSDHKLTVADKMRLFVIGSGGNYTDFQKELEKLHQSSNFDEIQKLKDEYSKKYGGDLDNDFLSKVADRDKGTFKDLLTPANGDGRQSFYENLKKYLSATGIVFDGSAQNNQRSVDQLAATLGEYQKVYQTLPPEKQKALDAYFNDSLEQYKNSKEKLAELASTALITAASIAAVVVTGGAATPLVMGAAFAAGGITKNLLAMGIEGSDFQYTAQNIAKQFALGGVTAVSNFIGGEAFGFGTTLSTIGEHVAADVAADVGSAVLREGGEDILKQSIPKLIAKGMDQVADADIARLVDTVAAQGATQAQRELIFNSIQAGLKDQASLIDKLATDPALKQAIQGAIESGVTGGVVNTGSTAAENVLNGQPIDLANLFASGFSGFAFGSAIHLGFTGATGAYLRVRPKEPAVAGETPRLFAAPDHGEVGYVKRGDTYYKIDGDQGQVLKLQNGDVPLRDIPAGTATIDPPLADIKDLNSPRSYKSIDPAKVTGDKDWLYREYTVDGRQYNLYKNQGDVWFKGTKSEPYGPIKLHIATSGPEDLANLQKVLIPALEDKNSDLYHLVSQWKTMDPQAALDPTKAAEVFPGIPFLPTGVGQNSKAFTIYVTDVNQAKLVQDEIDKLLVDAGLKLDHPLDTGTLDNVSGASNRIGIGRDFVPMANIKGGGETAALLQDDLTARIKNQLGVKPNQALTVDQLHQIEDRVGLKRDTLINTADSNGLALEQLGVVNRKDGNIYLNEMNADKTPRQPGSEDGGLSNRAAYYALSDYYRTSPLNASFDGPPLTAAVDGHPLEPGKTYSIGRSDSSDIQISDEPTISRDHARVRIDKDGNRFITDVGSSNGTSINGVKIPPNQEIQINSNDVVAIGAHRLIFDNVPLVVPPIEPPSPPVPSWIQVGSMKVEPKVGEEITIGRGTETGITNPLVSRQQAKIGLDENGYYIVDAGSGNGTFVTRNGVDTQVKPGEKFYLKIGDEIGLSNPVRDGGVPVKISDFVHTDKDVYGNPVTVTESNGRTYKKDGNEWNEFDNSGAKLNTPVRDVTVGADGTVKVQGADFVRTVNRDGSSTILYNSGAVVERDISDKVVDVKLADGTRQHMTYDTNGELSKIESEKDGKFASSYTKDASGIWIYGEAGQIPVKLKSVAVLPDGSIRKFDSNGFTFTRTDNVQFGYNNQNFLQVINATPETVSTLRNELEQSAKLYTHDLLDQAHIKEWLDKIDQKTPPYDPGYLANRYFDFTQTLTENGLTDGQRILKLEQKLSEMAGQTDRVAGAIPGIVNAGASSSFVDEITRMYQDVPENIRNFNAARGTQIVIAEDMYDFAPEFAGDKPRGYPEDSTWANPGGGHFSAKQAIYLPEYKRDPYKNNKWTAVHPSRETIFEETGHALDANLGLYSKSKDFIDAYVKDLQALPPADFEDPYLKYFLQGWTKENVKAPEPTKTNPYPITPTPTPTEDQLGGLSEAFAQVFVALQNNTNPPYGALVFLSKFDNVRKLMEPMLAGIH